jgi:hypothetical protein
VKASQHSSWNMELGLATVRWTPADAHRGFVTRGLWSWSRHPNFACEQTFWLLQALFPLLGTSPSLITRRGLVLSNPLYGALAVSRLVRRRWSHSTPRSFYFTRLPAELPVPSVHGFHRVDHSQQGEARDKIRRQPEGADPSVRFQHPIYASYQRLVGEFAPQETVLRGCIARMSGKREKWAQDVWG